VNVTRVNPRTVHQELTRNVLSAGEPSGFSEIVLNRADLFGRFDKDPEGTLRILHDEVAAGRRGADQVFALAELSFLYAEKSKKRAYYLSAALYAYAFLFPPKVETPPGPFDPRSRIASDLYNRALTAGLASPDGMEVEVRGGIWPLPFGELEVSVDPARLTWEDRTLTHFVPVADLEIEGFRNRYRRPGIGVPLAASMILAATEEGFQIAPKAKIPVTAFLRVEEPLGQLAANRVQATLELYVAFETNTVEVTGRPVPLEVEPTAVLAYALSGAEVWDWEFSGFLFGDILREIPTQLFAIEPYRRGRFPVVFVEGSACSPARWADMLNELQNDPRIRERFQFWFFTYETGNPVAYSAMRLREALQAALAKLDPAGRDPALRRMVVIGHSQGGLLTKLTAVDTGTKFWDAFSRVPLEELTVSPETRDLLRRALFVKPLPFVRRLIYLATPHRGSYVAGNWLAHQVARLVRLPVRFLELTDELVASGQMGVFVLQPGQVGSVYAMTPGSPLVRTLAPLPVAPGVATHSIIAVQGDGPVGEGTDGVVAYASAHIEGAESELVVRSGHSLQANPHTIEEVRRILLLHAAEACLEGIGCPGAGSGAPRQ
jgi:pimeloyl-ACP methyl ester carboxylesterase